jgi:hypothetical protein
VVAGLAVEELVKLSADVDLVVVGSRGWARCGGFSPEAPRWA